LKFTFKKAERLVSEKIIKELFANSSSFALYPFKVLYIKQETAQISPVQALFVAPKRAFKKAVDRNTIKRRMKEAYRLQKPTFYSQLSDQKISLAFVYIGKEIHNYKTFEKGMNKALLRIVNSLI